MNRQLLGRLFLAVMESFPLWQDLHNGRGPAPLAGGFLAALLTQLAEPAQKVQPIRRAKPDELVNRRDSTQ